MAPRTGLIVFTAILCGCGREPPATPPAAPVPAVLAPPVTVAAPASQPQGIPERIVLAARREVERRTPYQPGYHRIAYPGGDVPTGGVCTDLVVRAFRGAGADLQKLVHEDMAANFTRYPRFWGAAGPDANIDHRRVPNLMTFFRRKAQWLPTGAVGADAAGWQPGDVIFWDLPNGLKHCGVVSDRTGRSGLPLAIHNISQAAEEDCLTRWTIIGHARFPRLSTAQ